MARRELLFGVTKKDFDIQYFSGKGAGGQHRNKHQNCVRLIHKETGAKTTGQSSKSRIANKREAFNNMIKNVTFKMWMSTKTLEALGKETIEEKVEKQMLSKNIIVESYDVENNKWVEV